MTQAPLFVFIHVLGLAINMAWGPRARTGACCALGFPIGLATAVVMILALLVAGVPYNAWTFGVASLSLVAAASRVALRRGVDRRAMLLVFGWTLSFGAVACALSYANFSLMSFDSHQFVLLGRVIAADGAFTAGTVRELEGWGVFQAIAHSMVRLTSEDYLYGLQPVLAASFLAVFVSTLWDGVVALGAKNRVAKLLVALLTTALFTIYMLHRHFLYIHTNLASAVYLFGFALLYWLSEVRQDPSGVPVAFLFLLGFSLQRVEAPVFALVFLVLCVPSSTLPRRAIIPPLTGFTLIVAGWYEVLAHHVPSDGEFLTPILCRSFAGMMVAFYVYYVVAEWPPIRRLNRWLPQSMALACAVALAAAFALKPDHMLFSAHAWADNLLLLPYWGQAWYLIGALVVLGLAIEAPPYPRVFTYGVTLSFVIVMLLAIGRETYMRHVGDSANRMTLHPLPLLFAYFGLKIILVLAGPSRATPAAQVPT